MADEEVTAVVSQYQGLNDRQKLEAVKTIYGQEDLMNMEWVCLTMGATRPQRFERYQWVKERFVKVTEDQSGVVIAVEPTGNDPQPFIYSMAVLGGPQKMSLYMNMDNGKFSVLLDHVLTFDNYWDDLQKMLKKFKEKN
jgi:hypothetical protein